MLYYFQFNIQFNKMQRKLQKPRFDKLSSLENMRDGYNVYVKVVSVEMSTSQNGNFQIARAIVADDSGCANAFFKGQNTKHIVKGEVIAIRNGKIKLIKGHISLEIDIFGRITPEKMEINANTENNLSEKQLNRRPRFDRPREFKKRQQSREKKPFRNNRNERYQPKEENRFKNPRRENGDRKMRPKIEWTKIGGVEPGEDDLNIQAKVVSVENVKNMCRVVLGDETGVVKAYIPSNEHLKKDNTIVMFRCEANVVKEHIEIQLMRSGRIDLARNRNIEEVDEATNISAKAWVESA